MRSRSSRKGGLSEKPVTLHDIARHLGLSQRTVSQALNGRTDSTSRVSETTRRRVEAAALELGYRPNRAARALRTGRTGLVGVLSFSGLQHYGSVRLHGALKEMRRAGLPPLVYHSTTEVSEIRDACQVVQDASVDGILLLGPPPDFDQECLARVNAGDRPVVAIGGEHLSGISRYSPDRIGGFRAVVRHLLAEGRRSLCFLTSASHASPEMERQIEAGIEEVVRTASGPEGRIKSRVHPIRNPVYSPAMEESPLPGIHVLHVAGYFGMRELLVADELPDAVICRSDTVAQGALRACHEAHLAVPEQVAITGFDDEPASSAGWLPVTSVGFPDEEILRPAVEELRGLIRGELQPRDHLTLLPGRLAIRQSSRRVF